MLRELGLAVSGAIVLTTSVVRAQSVIVPDATLGAESPQVIPNYVGLPVEAIEGGAQRGQNLFHSFSQFNVSEGRGAYFAIPNDVVRNVLSRVTGGSRSEILGTLGTFRPSDGTVRVPGVNLFLINPNGIVFGENASLDVGGSFFATTANAVQLGDAGLFSASQPAASNLLNVNPSAFLFNAIANQNLPEIVVRSQATTTLLGNPTIGLQVPDGETLLLLGGNVTVNSGQLNAFGGHVDVGAVGAAGTVELLPEGTLVFPSQLARATVEFNQGSVINAASETGGSIGVLAETIRLAGGSVLIVGNTQAGAPERRAGDVMLDATGDITLSDRSVVANVVNTAALSSAGDVILTARAINLSGGARLIASTLGQGNAGNVIVTASDTVSFDGISANGQFPSGAVSSAELGSEGNGGNVKISTHSLSLTNGAQLISSTFSKGDAGNVVITASDAVSFDGMSADGRFPSGIASTAELGSEGNGGDVNISANTLSVTNNAGLSSSTVSQGDAGNVVIVAMGAVLFDQGTAFSATDRESEGNGGNINISAQSLSLTNDSFLNASTLGKGDAGDVVIMASGTMSLNLTSSSYLSASTSSQGNAGDVVIVASGTVSFDQSAAFTVADFGSEGSGGDVNISAYSLSLTNGAFLSTSTFSKGDAGDVAVVVRGAVFLNGGSVNGRTQTTIASSAALESEGKGGDVSIVTNSMSVNGGAKVNASTLGKGDAGKIVIRAQEAIQLNNGTIETRSQNSSGGDIQLSAERIRLFGNSDIRTFVEFGDGKGGDITLTAGSIIAFDDSDILTFSTGGQGGNITLNTRAFFGQNYRPGSPPPFDGNDRVDINASGTVSGIITLPDVSFLQNGLTEFPQTFTDTTQLLANSCIVRSAKQNGRFVITGSGGLPQRPGDAPLSPFPTGDVGEGRGGEGQGERREQGDSEKIYIIQNSKLDTQNLPDRPWKIGDPIVEPQGVYRLANGELVMSRECK